MNAPVLQQNTVIKRALVNRYDFDHVSIARDGLVVGHFNGGVKVNCGTIQDYWTADHNGHSTRVYNVGFHVGTVYARVKLCRIN